ncbi:MAG: helix-turn-helix transcriptional regulator [Chloroflexota bacterium]
MSVTTARQRILAFLEKNRSASARDVARALRMTEANARHHLGILAADGRVEAVSRKGGGKGRPQKVYRLGGKLAGDNLALLLGALLDGLPPDERERVLARIGRELAGSPGLTGQPLMKRLSAAVERLNSLHYQSRWEAGAEGPRLILGHCPYSAVIAAYPELCRMDAALLEELLGEEVRQTAKIESGGALQCVFAILPGRV